MGLLDKFRRKKQPDAPAAPQTDEISPGGSPIYRYQTPEEHGWRPPQIYGAHLEELTSHFQRIFPGRESSVFHELTSDLVHIDVHILKPAPDSDDYVLFTTGMSDLPTSLPEEIADREDLKYCELYMLLPGSWNLGDVGAVDRDLPHESYWPIQMLKFLARFPHEYHTWLGWGHTIPNGPNYTPISENVGFGGIVLAAPSLVPPLETEDGKKISFYLAIPAYREEIEYKLKYGMEELGKRFAEGQLPLALDVHRPNLCPDFQEILD